MRHLYVAIALGIGLTLTSNRFAGIAVPPQGMHVCRHGI